MGLNRSPFDPNSLQGWHLVNQRYQPLVPNERGWLWCETLSLWLGTWEGTIARISAVWLRFYDRDGNLVLLSDEAAQQQAEQAQQQAEIERQRAEQAHQQVEQAHQQAEIERQRAERLAARLREIAEDPDAL